MDMFKSVYICQQCSYETRKWYGKCPSCDAWNSFVETVVERKKSGGKKKDIATTDTVVKPVKLTEVKHIQRSRIGSGFGEFDQVVGGGIVPGSVTLLAGDPGIGKSTILLHVLSHVGGFYVSAEESAEQVKLRGKRMGVGGENISILATVSIESVMHQLREWRKKSDSPRIVVVDSIQTVGSDDLSGMPGTVGQIRRCGELLTRFAKDTGTAMIIIGHVTKQGTIAGPKVLEHMVDTVLYLEGERFATARILRTLKNRFGPIEEVGLFEMYEKGLKEIDNPSKLFIENRVKNVPGSVITVIMEGTRPLLVEIQALTVSSQLAMPRRVVNGFDYNRLQLILAILQKRMRVPLGTSDVFVNVSGGMKIEEPSADLAVALAILSSHRGKAIDPETAVFGEMGLLGEIRATISQQRREKEAKRLGYKTVISPITASNIQKAAEKLS